MKIQKKIEGGGRGSGGGSDWEGQGGCEQRIEFFCEISTKKSGGVGSGGRVWGQGGCERRIEVIVKIYNKIGGGGTGWVCQVRPGMGGSRGGCWSRGLVGSNVGGRGCCGVWGM